mgnify:CR=1 FL=1
MSDRSLTRTSSLESFSHIKELIDQGRYLEAQFSAESVSENAKDLRLAQLYALSLSKSGMPEEALHQIEPFYKDHPDDPETAGILGSIYKELFKKNQQTSYALLSRDTYLKNFTATKNYYTGINAAAMSAMIMQSSKSKDIAKEIISMIHAETHDFWELATLGEACLLVKDTTKAVEFYLKTRKAAGNDWGKISSVYNQLWLLNHYIPVQKEVMRIFSPPGIIAFIGHMIDHPDRKAPRFPAFIEEEIKNSITNNLRTINAHIGFSSVACGSDILFAEAMGELGRELNLFLPFNVADFIEVSVRFAGENWVDRFKSLLERFPVKIITEESYAGYDSLFNLQSKVIFGSALLRSMAHQNKTTLLTVLSETDLKRKVGGTNFSLSLWPYRENHVNINPDIFIPPRTVAIETQDHQQQVETLPGRKIWNLVVADLSGLMPLYKERVLKDLAQESTDALPSRTDVDRDVCLYAFESEFAAFDLMNHLMGMLKSLPKGQQVRIALHTGLAYETEDGLKGESIDIALQLNKLSFAGICASEHTAALLALQGAKYALDFAGSIVTPASGKYSVFRVSIPPNTRP